MKGYHREIGLSDERLAKRCGVGYSQIYMARTRNVDSDNAEKISRGVANILELSEKERLLLKAEIIGYPGNLLRAWLGNAADVSRLLDVPDPTARAILDPEKTITYKSGSHALEKRRKLGAPSFVTAGATLLPLCALSLAWFAERRPHKGAGALCREPQRALRPPGVPRGVEASITAVGPPSRRSRARCPGLDLDELRGSKADVDNSRILCDYALSKIPTNAHNQQKGAIDETQSGEGSES